MKQSIVSPSTTTVHPESELLAWLSVQKGNIAYVYSHLHFACFVNDGTETELFFSDIDKAGFAALTKFASSGRLHRLEVDDNELIGRCICSAAWHLLVADRANLSLLKTTREKTFGQGRGQAISDATMLRVWADAGARCMFEGCGQPLHHIALNTAIGQKAYLAHIVASDPDGPRGGGDSHVLSNDPTNIMLMCDEHHRLIDRIDLNRYPVERLRSMRLKHIEQTNYLLESLQWGKAQPISLLANLAAVPTHLSETDIKGAVIDMKRSPCWPILHEIRRDQRDDRSQPGFWSYLLHEHERDILQYQRNLIQSSEYTSVVIFPLHLVPILVLAGRIAGEAVDISVMQYHRERQSWRWDSSASASPSGTMSLQYAVHGTGEEVLLTIELTANLDMDALPEPLKIKLQQGLLTWIRIRHQEPHHDSIRHPDDLEQFTLIARQAIKKIHDEQRASMIHLIGVSPASAMFRFGQLLQAGHHPPYQVYDRPNFHQPFISGLNIHGDKVIAADSNQLSHIKTVPLR